MISLSALKAKRGPMCEWCKAEKAIHRHHCLIHGMKGHPELDDERNLMLVGQRCHIDEGLVNNYFVRVWFWAEQLKRYPDLREWYAGLPLKSKEYFD